MLVCTAGSGADVDGADWSSASVASLRGLLDSAPWLLLSLSISIDNLPACSTVRPDDVDLRQKEAG